MNWGYKFAAAAMTLAMSFLPSNAAESIKMGAISDPGYHSALWALLNGKVKDPSIQFTVDLMPIPAMIQASMTGQYDILPNGVLAVPQQKEAGINTVIMGSMIRHIPGPNNHTTDLWVKNDSPIKSIQDLKGKRIAVTSIEAQDVIFRRAVMMERYGINASALGGDVRWVEIPAPQFEAALESGQVDAVAFSNVLAYRIANSGKYRSVFQGANELKDMYGGPAVSVLLTAPKDKIDRRPEVYKVAARLLRESAEYVLAHQDEVFSDVAPKYNMTKADLQGWFTTYAGMPFAIGPTDKKVYEAAWRSGNKLGLLATVPATADDFIWPFSIQEK
jgi:NitT/TauT family transport system substrate-binding protein